MAPKKEACTLTPKQVEWNLNNLFTVLRVKPKQTSEVKTKAGSTIRMLVDGSSFAAIVLQADLFDIRDYEELKGMNDRVHPFGNGERPNVYVCISTRLLEREYARIPPLFDVPYRIVVLASIHPITGSPNGLAGFVMDYERLETKERAFNGRDYAEICDNDPAVKITNALVGDLIRAKVLYNDSGNCYTQYRIRRVRSNVQTTANHLESGLLNPAANVEEDIMVENHST